MTDLIRTAEFNSHFLRMEAASARKAQRFIAERTDIQDVLEHRRLENVLATNPSGFASEIAKHLRHIPVNPNNQQASDLLRMAYVHSSDKDDLPSNGQYLNFSESSLRNFIESLTATAQKERLLSTGEWEGSATIEAAFSDEIYIIKGERGVGKTFLLNYALTKYSEYLDEEKTIWVRINFVYSTGFESGVLEWMLAQASKVILRYYDKASDHFGKKIVDICGSVFAWIDSHPNLTGSEKLALRVNLRRMIDTFCRVGSDQGIRPGLCNVEICTQIYREMRRLGWSFVFVLDGFDQLDINPEQIDRFRAIKDSVVGFLSTRAVFGAAIVIVTRSNTFYDLKAIDPFRNISPLRQYLVDHVDFRRVVTRRFEAIKKVIIERIARTRYDDALKMDKIIEDFTKAALNYIEGADFDASAWNMRAKLQALYLLFIDFVDRTTGKGYLVIEHMMLNGCRYPAIAYNYSQITPRALRARQSTELKYEARFLPVLTRCPRASAGEAPSSTFEHLLTGIRCIQIVCASEKLNHRQERLSVGEMKEMLGFVLDYKAHVVDATLRELCAFDVIRLSIIDGLSATSDRNILFELPKAEYMLKKSIFEVAYLNMCAMRSHVNPKYFVESIIDANFLGLKDHDARLWIKSKTCNALALYCLMLQANHIEDVLSKKKNARLSDRQQAVFDEAIQLGLFKTIPGGSRDIARQCMQIIESGSMEWFTFEDRVDTSDQIRRIFDFFAI